MGSKMFELTKEILEKLWYGKWDKKLVKQLLDDYEKARKYDQIRYPDAVILSMKQNQKLRELIEKRIKDGNELCQELFDKGVTHPSCESEIETLQELLEESKK